MVEDQLFLEVCKTSSPFSQLFESKECFYWSLVNVGKAAQCKIFVANLESADMAALKGLNLCDGRTFELGGVVQVVNATGTQLIAMLAMQNIFSFGLLSFLSFLWLVECFCGYENL